MADSISGRPARPPLTPDLWRRVKGLAGEALDRPETDRGRFVADACGEDETLREEVESLLRSTARAADRLESLAPAVPVVGPGERVGAYRLVREIGAGGMGAVYLAERVDEEFQQRVAIKFVRGGFATAWLLQRFREERRILASLEHPSIARLLDGGTTETGLPYVVMEYVEGEPIDTFCTTNRWGLHQRLRLFCEACAAVHYAHQRLVIHRDIKAGNLLVTSGGVPKLLDFGIAKLLDDEGGVRAHTTYRVMTPESASPEQLRGQPITIAADVYALGVLLYRLIAGVGPYGTAIRSEADLILAVCERTPAAPSAYAHGNPDAVPEPIPSDLDLIVLKALRKEPERRYGSADQLADDVRRFLEGRAVLAAPDSSVYRLRKFVGRHRAAAAAVIALFATLCAGVGATAWQARRADRERTRAEALRARAERQFNAVRALANSVIGELHQAVVNLPGSTAAREILLRRATEYLDALSREVQQDVELRRELAAGYRRLAEVQGAAGVPNLGDQATAQRSYLKAAGLLEALRAESADDVRDRVALADTYNRLAAFEKDTPARGTLLERARVLVEDAGTLTPPDAAACATASAVWNSLGDVQIEKQDYEGGKGSRRKSIELGERALQLEPDNLSWSRNVSLYYKKLGALLEFQGAVDEAIALYQKAMALDRDRIAREPGRLISRLDLSFAYGSMGSALRRKNDLRGALEQYGHAIALRQEVAAGDPKDDFAQTSVAYGFERIAQIKQQLGDTDGALESMGRRVAIYRTRMETHRDRDNVWRDYATTTAAAIGFCLTALESSGVPAPSRRSGLARVTAMLRDLTSTRTRWTRDGRSGTLPPEEADLAALSTRVRKLGG